MIIDIVGLRQEYGEVRALKGIDLGIKAGGVIGLLGPNGAGKTTLVETILGLRPRTAGQVSVLGIDPTQHASALRERVGAQLQSTVLPQDLNPLETLRLFAAFYSKSLPPKQLLERFGLSDKSKSRNYTLSGGQQRRLAIAMALINDPELVILDEPTSGLDPIARREIHEQIETLRKDGRTVLLTTHYVEETEALCDRVLFLRSGTIVADGRPADLIAQTHGKSTLWLSVEGTLDPSLLLEAGAISEGKEGDYQRFATPDIRTVILALGETLHRQSLTLLDLRMKRPGLEDLYLDLMEKS